MLKLLETILSEMGYQAPHFINGDNSTYTKLVIKKDTVNVICSINVHNTLLNEENLDKVLKNKLTTLFFNDIWFKDGSEITKEKLDEFVEENYPSDLPEEKMLRMLNYLRSYSEFDGQQRDISHKTLFSDRERRRTYMYNAEEMLFYMETLFDAGLIKYNRSEGNFYGLHITVLGLNKLISENERIISKNCFIAMSFDKSLRGIYDNGIVPAIKASGFEPLRVDDDNKIPNEVTINDAILAAIKKSKFVIADFTEHKRGVYFEAAYALGLGRKVIYTCREDQIKDAHFDTRNYSHIVWKDEEDLRKKLIDKIDVFIKA